MTFPLALFPGTVISNLQIAGGFSVRLSTKQPSDYVSFDAESQAVIVIRDLDKESFRSVDFVVSCLMVELGFTVSYFTQ